MLVSDTAPDVWDGRTDVLLKMYDSGWVLPLDRHLARDKVALDRDWVPTGVERWRQKVYGVPYWADSYAIYYNKTLFRQKGAEDPWERSRNRGQWTLEELVGRRPPGARPGRRRVGPGLGPGQPHRDRAPDLDAGRLPRADGPQDRAAADPARGGGGARVGPGLDDAPAAERAGAGAGGHRGAGAPAGRAAGDRHHRGHQPLRPGPGRDPLALGRGLAADVAPDRHRLRVGHAPRAQHQGQAGGLADRQPPPQRLGQDEAPGRGLGLHEVDDPGRVPGLPGRAPLPDPRQAEPPGAVLPRGRAVPLPAPPGPGRRLPAALRPALGGALQRGAEHADLRHGGAQALPRGGAARAPA